MAADPDHRADLLVAGALGHYFGDRCPVSLGRSGLHLIGAELRKYRLDPASAADEILQRATLQACRHLERHGSASVDDPRPWFLAICRNTTYRHWKRQQAERTQSLEELTDSGRPIPLDSAYARTRERTMDPFALFHDQERQALARRVMASLPPRMRELLHLDLVEQLSAEEIRGLMGFASSGSFRVAKHHAFRALRDALEKQFPGATR